jgi:DNA invertase Pin-like site-specific DNA recombinase
VAKPPVQPQAGRPIRCAIYTRKSTDEGLDKEFNSLDAQREACAAYVVSQRHEGWNLLPELYDDGGYSGGTMERPALKRLLADVEAGKVDVIVLYKIDRLTRALSDFAKIVEVLDAAGASFVSITQAFNTTTSMGRLMLNVLLSFAQFEREVISERVRDKVSASKRKGMWMGGPIPLGYDVVDRKLIVNEAEATTVRHIYRRYVELGSVRELSEALERDSIISKPQVWRNGRMRGGTPFGRGALYGLLSQQIYRGLISHKGQLYPGQHDAIVPEEMWNEVQAMLATNAVDRRHSVNARNPSLLAGMIHDEAGRRMAPSHAAKGSVRYRYYATVAEDNAQQGKRPLRIAAGEVEASVIGGIKALLSNEPELIEMLSPSTSDATGTSGLIRRARALAAALPTIPNAEMRALALSVDLQVVIGEQLDASIDLIRLATTLGTLVTDTDTAEHRITLPIAGTILRRGHQMRLAINPEPGGPSNRDGRIIALLLKAQDARHQLFEVADADAEPPSSYSQKHLARMARLTFLAPDITAAILDGTQPASLTARKLLKMSEMPLAWTDQRKMLGFS